MRHDRHIEFLRHEHHGHDFVDAADAAGVGLTDVDGVRLEELFEDDAVLAHFSCCDKDAEGFEGAADGGVAQDVVRGGGLFDEPGFVGGEVVHVGCCFWDGPYLHLFSNVP